MRYFLFLFLIFFCSCQFFNKERFDTNTILEKELKVFKWDKLDQYPSFETCDEKINFEQNKNCFESVITNHIIKFFSNNDRVFSTKKNDTLMLEIRVTKLGELSILSPEKNYYTDYDEFVRLLKESLFDLPVLYPGIKRSQHVDTSFKLPIILNTY